MIKGNHDIGTNDIGNHDIGTNDIGNHDIGTYRWLQNDSKNIAIDNLFKKIHSTNLDIITFLNFKNFKNKNNGV